MTYSVGSLVKTRGREWVVLPETTPDWLILRPLGGMDKERTGIYLPLEGSRVESASFALPKAEQLGDYRSSRMLREAVRLGFRASAGPFRSFAKINVEARPYQLVPLLMALKLDPIRLLIADDVGIGKTIEAGLIARELIDRGEVQRMAVLCPPQLVEQWQRELKDKFNLEAVLVLSSTINRLERHTSMGQSLFEQHPVVIVSTEYIKSPRRRDEFIRTCPPLVIVDEAHSCAFSPNRNSSRHLRHKLLQSLVEDENRHLILVTATPHSGDEGAFRSLLTLLNPTFTDLPDDLSGNQNRKYREAVAQHLVQRRRANINAYLDTKTVFPTREESEANYVLTSDYKKLFDQVLIYARERVLDKSQSQRHQRVSWWSALALLRSLASSPAAAAATLQTRSATAESESVESADAIGKRVVMDLDDTELAEMFDIIPGSWEGEEQSKSDRERLLRLARQAKALQGTQNDAKLKTAITLVKKFLADGFNPILFCRFIDTAEYVAAELRLALPAQTVEVSAVTGQHHPAEREARIHAFSPHKKRVLVATDCLSEGINLQNHFNAVIHYDLSWNPTRHEQREGRVDRYGQPNPVVRALTYYGLNNQIDGLVLDVLLKKHQAIRNSLGISVPVPDQSNQVLEALLQGLLLRGSANDPRQLSLFDQYGGTYEELHLEWDNATEKEKRSRAVFAQQSIKVEQVAEEWATVRAAIGAGSEVKRFVEQVVSSHGGHVAEKHDHTVIYLPNQATIREACGGHAEFKVRYELPIDDDMVYLHRTHPWVEALAAYVLDSALDPLVESEARRCGAIRTAAITTRTTLVLLRLRYHLVTRKDDTEIPLLAEDSQLVAFTGSTQNAVWLSAEIAEKLLQAEPSGNIQPQQAQRFIQQVIDGYADLQPHFNEIAVQRGEALLQAHDRVRTAAKWKGVRHRINPQLPPDVLGIYVLLPNVG